MSKTLEQLAFENVQLRAALQAIVDHVDKDRKKFADSFVLLGPRAAMPLYNIARAALTTPYVIPEEDDK